MNSFYPVIGVIGRLLMALVFILSGFGKIAATQAMQGYMASVGLPGFLIYPTIAFEILGAMAIMLGWQTRVMAFLFAGFSVLTALLFHHQLGDQMQFIMFMKNIAIAGGFLLLAREGAGELSIDHYLRASDRTVNT